MIITIFISEKYRISFDTEITDYVRDTFEVDSKATSIQVSEIINKRMDTLSRTLHKSISAQLHAQIAS